MDPTLPRHSVFMRTAIASGLVTQDQIQQVAEAIRRGGGLDGLPTVTPGDERLAESLVEQGRLTRYQADQLRQGHSKLSLGPYLITDWLGQGGMGQVFAARHRMMDRVVAIKVLPRSKSTPEAIASFTREIQTQGKLHHRHLVHAYDAGHDGNVYFLVTEYVPGTDLRRLVRAQGPLPMAQAASLIQQAAIGLGYAHQQGLVHRDVKPGNLLVTPEGLVKVSDLGLAGFLHEGDDDPRAGKIVGTADYLAPERITHPAWSSPVSDLYALGCTLYYAVTGKVPFPGGSTREKARRHCEETPWHPRQFNPELSDEFADLIADLMEKDPQRRVQTAEEVARRLAAWAQQAPVVPYPVEMSESGIAPPVPSSGQEMTMEEGAVAASVTATIPSLPPALAAADASSRSVAGPSRPFAPPAPISTDEQRRQVRRAVAQALAIAVPASLIAGGLLTWLLIAFLQR